MADRRRLVAIDSAGTVTLVKDLEDVAAFFAVRGSFQVKPGAAKAIDAERQRRFGGSLRVGETHENGTVAWRALVKGTTADLALSNAESLFAALKTTRQDLFFEWRPDGATFSTYYEIRGTATLTPTYQWAQFVGGKSWYLDIEIPVGPLARGDVTTIAIPSTTLPAVVQLGTAIPGSAPALADIQLRKPSGTATFALFAWTRRLGTPLAGTVAPFGIIEAEAAFGTSGWVSTADALYRGGNGLKITTAGVGTAQGSWNIDPSVMDVDDFSPDDVDVEVWARVQLASTVVAPTLTLRISDAFAGRSYTAEYGSVGKLLTVPSTGSAFRFVRLGTLSMPVNKVDARQWSMTIDAAWAASSSGVFGLDYLVLVPSRARALSPSGKPFDSTYPSYMAGTADFRKTIRGADLSGMAGTAAGGSSARASGLGGSAIELPPGNVDLLLKWSDIVPDDPTASASSEALSHTGVTGTVFVTPRYYIAKGA